MLFLKVSCIISLVGRNWPTAKNISCAFLSVVVTIHICSWDISLNLKGSPYGGLFCASRKNLWEIQERMSHHTLSFQIVVSFLITNTFQAY